MRKIILVAVLFILLGACSQSEYMMYDDYARLQFGPTPDKIYIQQSEWEDTLKTFSFLSLPTDKIQDTVYFDIYSIGVVSNDVRHYELEQIMLEETDNAVPGVHYKSFDDTEVKDLFVIPQNSAHALVPIILLRDTSLETKEYVLKFRIKENADFKLGDSRKCWRKLIMADVLLQPNNWIVGYFGTYSKVKHRFMMAQTGLEWDEEYINSIKSDVSLCYYWQRKLQELLYDYNNDPANEDTPLLDENGYEVKFGF